MLNADLALSNEVDEWNKAQRAKKRKGASEKSQGKATRKKKKKDDEEPGFHFIAFVPINGSVWRLDGMQHQPVSLGELPSILQNGIPLKLRRRSWQELDGTSP